MSKLPVICLMGPTAIGKTDLAISIYKDISLDLPVDIISVDSAMIYKGLNIGTGKPEQEILSKVPHHLVDIREPSDIYSVADFCHDVRVCIDNAHQNKRIPLLVGGTMMYFHALQAGLSKLPSADMAIRRRLQKKVELHGLSVLYQELLKCDPITAKRLDQNDTQRILRALEVFELTGKPMSETINQQARNNSASNYEFINIAMLVDNRVWLHNRIAMRFHKMLEQGFLSEVEILFNNAKLNIELPAIRSVGYRQAWMYLQGEYTKDEMTERAIIATRQLAKRQFTWLRSWKNINIYDTQDVKYKENIITNLLALDLLKRIV